MTTKPRILCLHGKGSNSDITVYQTLGLKLSKRMQCVNLNAPHEVPSSYPGLEPFSKGPWRSWADLSSANGGDQWEESLQHIAKFVEENGPFDGVYGFSQGTAIITEFSHPRVWRDKFKMNSPPWKFAILACGGASSQINIPKDSNSTIDIPSFHIFGKTDPHFDDSNKIAEYWDAKQRLTHTHSGGHYIDLQMSIRETEIIAGLNKFLEDNLPR